MGRQGDEEMRASDENLQTCKLANLQTYPKHILFLSTLLLVLISACQRSPNRVEIVVDEEIRLDVSTQATTVRELLQEEGIVLGELDRVEPDLYVTIKPQMQVRVIRVTETIERESIEIPFPRRIVVNEGLPIGEQRLAQLGVNGEEEIITKIIYEDGIEVDRTEVSRGIAQHPVEEVLVVGGLGALPTVHFTGTIAYLSGGNAWLMRNNNAARRPLTREGDLDGRVFSLSPNGESLLYSRTVTDVIDAPLNELWLVNTRIVGEPPISLPIKGVLYADWVPHITQTVIAYSTAERVPSQPGWRANNDLWLWTTNDGISQTVAVITANTRGLYPWWGANFAISPDANRFAYANANEVGVIDIISKTDIINVISSTITPLMEFVPFQTNSEWVWVPSVSWSPDSRFIATVIHGPPLKDEKAEASQVFDMWFLAADGSLKIKVWEQTGMWSNPIWHSKGVAFGRAVDPLRSINSRYKLSTIDRDGSNSRLIFPFADEIGLDFPEVAWMPEGDPFAFVYQNNLYMLKNDGTPPQQLTSDNQSHNPLWVIGSSLTIITQTTTLSLSTSITETTLITSTEVVSATSLITP